MPTAIAAAVALPVIAELVYELQKFAESYVARKHEND